MRWILVVAAALLLTSCASDDGPATAPTVRFPMAASTDGTPPERAALPLSLLRFGTRSDQHLVELATHHATAACMAARGFDFPAYRDEVAHLDAAGLLLLNRIEVPHPFGPWTEAEVADGYGPSVGPAQPPTALDEFVAALSSEVVPSWSAAYGGGDPFGGERRTITLPDGSEVESGITEGGAGGCYRQGLDAVHGDSIAREALRTRVEAMGNDALVEAEDHDDTVDQALDAWHDCMEAQGFDVRDGGAGPDELQLRHVSEPGVSDEERRAATQDIGCKEQANLHDAFFAALAAAEQQQIQENQPFFEAWREQRNDDLRRARDILGRP